MHGSRRSHFAVGRNGQPGWREARRAGSRPVTADLQTGSCSCADTYFAPEFGSWPLSWGWFVLGVLAGAAMSAAVAWAVWAGKSARAHPRPCQIRELAAAESVFKPSKLRAKPNRERWRVRLERHLYKFSAGSWRRQPPTSPCLSRNPPPHAAGGQSCVTAGSMAIARCQQACSLTRMLRRRLAKRRILAPRWRGHRLWPQ